MLPIRTPLGFGNLFPVSETSSATAGPVPPAVFGRSNPRLQLKAAMNLVCKRDRGASPAFPLQQGHCSNRNPMFGFIGALGVLALIFSALSPHDDDIQQEFAQVGKNRQRVVRNWKSIPSVCATLVSPVQQLVARSLFCFCRSAIGRVVVSDAKIGATVFPRRIGGRSPPPTSLG